MNEEALAQWGAVAPKANKTRLIRVCVLCVRVIYSVLHYFWALSDHSLPYWSVHKRVYRTVMHRETQRPLDYRGNTLDLKSRVTFAPRCMLLTCKKNFPLTGHKDL